MSRDPIKINVGDSMLFNEFGGLEQGEQQHYSGDAMGQAMKPRAAACLPAYLMPRNNCLVCTACHWLFLQSCSHGSTANLYMVRCSNLSDAKECVGGCC